MTLLQYASIALFFVLLITYFTMRYYGVGVGKTAIREARKAFDAEFRVKVQEKPVESAFGIPGTHVPNLTPDRVLLFVGKDSSVSRVLVFVYAYRAAKQKQERLILAWGDFTNEASRLEIIFTANEEKVIACDAYEGAPPKFEADAAREIREVARQVLRDHAGASLNTVPGEHDRERLGLSEPPPIVMPLPSHVERRRPRS